MAWGGSVVAVRVQILGLERCGVFYCGNRKPSSKPLLQKRHAFVLQLLWQTGLTTQFYKALIYSNILRPRLVSTWFSPNTFSDVWLQAHDRIYICTHMYHLKQHFQSFTVRQRFQSFTVRQRFQSFTVRQSFSSYRERLQPPHTLSAGVFSLTIEVLSHA